MSNQRKRVQANGSTFAVTDLGDEANTAVVLLHGFPLAASMWGKQVGPLLEAGYRVVAPDLKGAVGGESDAPADAAAYDVPTQLTQDRLGILDALGVKKAHIVGHDWGALFAWAFSGFCPDRVLFLVAISCGHPTGYLQHEHGALQKQLSWYYWLFQVPGLAEKAVASGEWAAGLVSKEAAEVEGPMWQELKWLEAVQKPGAVTEGLNWYRANGKPDSILKGFLFEAPPAQCNVLQTWPTGDAPFCSEGGGRTWRGMSRLHESSSM